MCNKRILIVFSKRLMNLELSVVNNINNRKAIV